jgi:hypothetical protein
MTTWSDYPHGRYDGQPVQEGHHGRLVYDCQPETEDGCIVPVPAGFLGIPKVPAAGEPDEYVTEISVPSFDDGRQALYSPELSEPEPGS